MIDLNAGQIVQGEKSERIIRFEVWWVTPFGLCRDIAEAKKVMDQNELPMQLVVQPVPVAIGEGTLYEPYMRSG